MTFSVVNAVDKNTDIKDDKATDIPGISPINFYRPLGQHVHSSRVLKHAALGVSQSLSEFRMALLKKSPVRIYPTQAGALNYIEMVGESQNCKSHFMQRLYMFSFEFDKENAGRRQFMVAMLPEFWQKLLATRVEDRHFYEVIRENTPCKLYFDIEYELELNKDVDGGKCVEYLKKVVLKELFSLFGIRLDPVAVVDLDSSTLKKFSRHLIVNAQNAVFKNNGQAGLFVQHVSNVMYETAFGDGDSTWTVAETDRNLATAAFVLDSKGHRNLFVDMAVYSRNRNFRLLGNRKLGKDAMLTYTGAESDDFTAQQLWDSMVVAVNHEGKLLSVEESDICASPSKRHTHTPSKDKPLLRTYNLEDAPFPEIDQYVVSHIKRMTGDSGVTVRSVKLETVPNRDGFLLVYYPTHDHRFCFNLKPPRHHKSNHVYYVLEIPACVFYQKCFDPDCAAMRYTGPRWNLPAELNPIVAGFDTKTPSPPFSVDSNSSRSTSGAFHSAVQSLSNSPTASLSFNSLTIKSPLSSKSVDVWSDTSLEDLISRNLI